MPTEYQLEKVRQKARDAGKSLPSDKKKRNKKKAVYKSPKTDRQHAMDEINEYKMKHYGKPSSSTVEKAKPTAASGGSKSVRKITSPGNADSTPLIEKLKKKPFKYIKTR